MDYLMAMSEKYAYTVEDGKEMGKHQGAHYFTIGQRKGLNVGGTPLPLFVLETDTINNVIYTGQGSSHPGLNRRGLRVLKKDVHWLRDDLQLEPGEERNYLARIRYRQALQKAKLIMRDEVLFILFEEDQNAIASGQFVVWYEGEELIGSGVIH
jgi:tRNA-specific 2-thiouridylase